MFNYIMEARLIYSMQPIGLLRSVSRPSIAGPNSSSHSGPTISSLPSLVAAIAALAGGRHRCPLCPRWWPPSLPSLVAAGDLLTALASGRRSPCR